MKAKLSQKNGRSRGKQSRQWVFVLLLILALTMIGFSVYSYASEPENDVYAAEDVGTSQPIFAVHDMSNGPPIPFLSKNQPQPNIEITETFYDFGTIGAKDIVEREFTIRNTGEAPLTISRAYTTCGCTTAEISANVIQPGKAATIKLVYDAGFHDATGQTVRRGLIIENNDREMSQAEIWIQATVRSN